jgi:hypothetical protein
MANFEALAGAAACMKALQSAFKIERRGFDNPETNDSTVENREEAIRFCLEDEEETTP